MFLMGGPWSCATGDFSLRRAGPSSPERMVKVVCRKKNRDGRVFVSPDLVWLADTACRGAVRPLARGFLVGGW